MIDAIVLSGGEIEPERFPGLAAGTARRARVLILDTPMVEWVVRGLRDCRQIGRIVVVGHESLETLTLRALDATVTLEAGGIAENLRAGLDALPGARRILALSGDLP